MDHCSALFDSEVVRQDIATVLSRPLPWHELAGREILVSGAGGFIGAHILHVLASARERGLAPGMRIIGMIRPSSAGAARIARLVQQGSVQILQADVTAPLAAGVASDLIIHAASPATPKAYSRDPTGVIAANVFGTANLLEVARRNAQCRFLYVSSGEVYGNVSSSQVPTPEGEFGMLDPASLRSCYAESKRLSETMCVAHTHQFDVDTVIVRPFHTYGPGIDLNDGRIFSDIVSSILERRDIVLTSSGEATRSFCYISDAISGLFTVMFHGARATAYNVGNGSAEIAIRDLALVLADEFRDRGIRVCHDPSSKSEAYMASPIQRNAPDTRRLEALGWHAGVGIRAGFRRTVTAIESSHVTPFRTRNP